MFKLLKLVAILAVLVVALGLWVLVSLAESGSREAIELGAGYATETKVTVFACDVGVLSSSFAILGLRMANPEGFETGSFR